MIMAHSLGLAWAKNVWVKNCCFFKRFQMKDFDFKTQAGRDFGLQNLFWYPLSRPPTGAVSFYDENDLQSSKLLSTADSRVITEQQVMNLDWPSANLGK